MKQVCVIGLGQFGSHLARTLVRLGCEVLAIDQSEARVDDIRDEVHRALIGDARSPTLIKSVVPPSVDDCVISLGKDNIEPSMLCALSLRKLGVKSIRSTARNDDHAYMLKAVGATEIIFPERESAERTGRRLANPDLRDMFSLAEDYRIMEIVAPRKLAGKSLQQLDLRKAFDVLVLAVRPVGAKQFSFLPGADTVIHPDETLMVLGRELDLVRLMEL